MTQLAIQPAPLVIRRRERVLVNTDPQRRCYNGCNFSEELQWSAWEVLERMRLLKPGTDPEERLKFWRGLNDYAVSQRGKGSRCEFELAPEESGTTYPPGCMSGSCEVHCGDPACRKQT